MKNILRPVLIGGFILTFISGIVNAVGFLSFAHQGLTHLTGLTTHISIKLSEHQYMDVFYISQLILSFVIGSIISGAVIKKSTLKLGRHYGIVLLLESALLYFSIHFLEIESQTGECMIACACGLQNAMATTYSGSILRTTHLTGIFTDLGLWIGHYISKLPVESSSLKIYLVLISGFICGGGVGVYLFKSLEYKALLVPAVLLGVVGLIYIYFSSTNKNEASENV
jgi:uncharacterized membrane protein YoaK (UPF0700 family)